MGKRGMVYEVRSTRKLPAPTRDMTQKEADELKRLELAFIECAHKLGVRVCLKLTFPYEVEKP